MTTSLSVVAALLPLAALVLATVGTVSPTNAAGALPGGPLTFTVKDIDGKNIPLSRYKGEVVLIVNTASQCGYTPQYAKLEALYQKYKDQGLRILAFPSNDFGGQEPGSETEIKQFCTMKYKTTFDLFGKVKTSGENADPLYQWLTGKNTNGSFGGPIEWNFTKFLVGRDGKVLARFKSAVDPMSPDFTAAVEAALKAAKPTAKG